MMTEIFASKMKKYYFIIYFICSLNNQEQNIFRIYNKPIDNIKNIITKCDIYIFEDLISKYRKK